MTHWCVAQVIWSHNIHAAVPSMHTLTSLLLTHQLCSVAVFCPHISLCGGVRKEGTRTHAVPALYGKPVSLRGFISCPRTLGCFAGM